MSELLLVKRPMVYSGDVTNYPLSGEQVVGITPSQSPTVLEYGYVPTGDEVEQEVSLDDDVSERIIEFYDQTLARDPGERPFYNCHLFAFYALGKATKLKNKRLRLSDVTIVPNDSFLKAGEAYGTTTPEGVINHSILGIDEPMHNISVIGDYSPMVVSRNSDIMPFYGAVQLQHMSPRSPRKLFRFSR